MTTYDYLLNRVAFLEHKLRRASEKFTWLSEYHCKDEFAKTNCNRLADEFWKAQDSSAAVSQVLPKVAM